MHVFPGRSEAQSRAHVLSAGVDIYGIYGDSAFNWQKILNSRVKDKN